MWEKPQLPVGPLRAEAAGEEKWEKYLASPLLSFSRLLTVPARTEPNQSHLARVLLGNGLHRVALWNVKQEGRI